MDRINDDAQAIAKEGLWVRANKDFRYDEAVGEVKLGQVFQLGGHINDAGLLRHSLVAPLDPQPSAAQRKRLPACGTCGRVFAEMWHRDRCGLAHEAASTDVVADRRHRVHNRIVEERVIQVGM